MAKPPSQPRAVKTREKLMAALKTLLKGREFEHISIADIAAEAGVAVGSVYSHFEDKNAFLAAMLDHHMDLVRSRLDEVEAQNAEDAYARFGDLRAALGAAMQGAYAQLQSDAHIIRALHTYARLNDAHPDEARTELVRRAFQRVLGLLQAYGDEIRRTDLQEAARVVNYFLNVIFLEKAMFPQAGPLGDLAPSDEVFVEAATAMLYGYLTAPERQGD